MSHKETIRVPAGHTLRVHADEFSYGTVYRLPDVHNDKPTPPAEVKANSEIATPPDLNVRQWVLDSAVGELGYVLLPGYLVTVDNPFALLQTPAATSQEFDPGVPVKIAIFEAVDYSHFPVVGDGNNQSVTCYQNAFYRVELFLNFTNPTTSNMEFMLYMNGVQVPGSMIKTNGFVVAASQTIDWSWNELVTNGSTLEIYAINRDGSAVTLSINNAKFRVERVQQLVLANPEFIEGDLQFHAMDGDPVFDPGVLVGDGDISEDRTGAIVIPGAGSYQEVAGGTPAIVAAFDRDFVYCSPEGQNEVLHSDNLGDPAWDDDPVGLELTKDQVGIDGTPDSAWLMANGISNSSPSVAQSPDAIDGEWATVRAIVKKGYIENTSGSIGGFTIFLPSAVTNPGLITNLTDNSFLVITSGDTGAAYSAQQLVDDWWEICFGAPWESSFRYKRVAFNPMYVFLPIGREGDVIVDNLEYHVGKRPEEVLGTPIVRTTAAPATVNGTSIKFTIANHENLYGLYYADVVFFTEAVSNYPIHTAIIRVGDNDEAEIVGLYQESEGTALWASRDLSGAASTPAPALTGGALHIAMAYSQPHNLKGVADAERIPGTDQYAGFNVGSEMLIGPQDSPIGRPFLIRNIRRYGVTVG